MNAWPLSIKKIKSGQSLLILFDDNCEFSISAELLRVEGPSADIQGHGGPKIIVKNKSNVLINKIEQVGNYAIRIIFSDDHSSGIFSWDLLYDFGINQETYLSSYYNSL
ncbi:gamma-butyrobetaine hydroxylase-like domain-containing protein [bacterium]|nr:gamma-butyrobetaine hydroxylase-like domain-containing protein [bacterium]